MGRDWAGSCGARGPPWVLSMSSCLCVTRSRLYVSFFLRHLSQQLQNSKALRLRSPLASMHRQVPIVLGSEDGSRSEVPLEKSTRIRPGGSRWRESLRIGRSLEAIAVLVALMLCYGGEEQEHRGSIRTVPTITNNRGNGSALNKLMSTKYPACEIIMEIASFMKKKRDTSVGGVGSTRRKPGSRLPRQRQCRWFLAGSKEGTYSPAKSSGSFCRRHSSTGDKLKRSLNVPRRAVHSQ